MTPHPHSHIERSPTVEFPYGFDVDTLIVCINEQHRRNVIVAFKLPAHYITPNLGLSGRRYSNIIIFHQPSLLWCTAEIERYERWVTEYLPTKLTPEGIIHHV